MEIAEPTLLAKLPRAGPSEEGCRYFSQVYGLRDGKSKKRHEICAAIDGNSLNIFEVVNGRNLASWPIPPDASFVSQPYSERQYADSETSTRTCWCALQRKGQTTIQCYKQIRTGATNTSTTTSHELRNSSSPIIKIIPLNANRRLIVVIQEDGSVTCIQSDEKMGRHDHKLGLSSGPVKLQAVHAMSLEEARASVLRGRPDISATLMDDHTIFAAAYVAGKDSSTSTSGLNLGIWAVTPVMSIPSTDQISSTPIVTYDLRISSRFGARFNPACTKLDVLAPNSVATFDLTTATPQKISERKHFTADQTSEIELSHDINMSFGSGTLHLYNSKFNSLLASRRVNHIPLKRKRERPGLSKLTFIAYFSQLRRILAYNGSQILAVDIHASDSAQDPFKKSSLLVGNILRGKPDQRNVSQAAGDSYHNQDWLRISRELDTLVAAQDASGFERKFDESLGVNQWEDLKKLDSSQIKFLISRMFNVESKDERQSVKLKLAFAPVQLLKWCIKCGFTDDYQVATALEVSTAAIAPGGISECIQKADEELHLLEEYVKNAPHIQASILTWTIKSLIDRALRTTEADTAQLKSLTSEMDLEGQNGAQDLNQGLLSAQEQDASSTNCLIYGLKRLALTGSATVSDQIRTIFEQKEVLALIQFLRQQLFVGGFTRLAEARNYPSPPSSQTGGEDKSGDDKPQMTLDSIVTLMNGCIDSLGVVGILGSNEDQAFIERMIPELYSEIESATAAVEDSTYLQGILRETLRYAESVEKQPFEVRSKVERAGGLQGKKGKIVTLYTESDASEGGSQIPTSLPLSLKAEEDLSRLKIRKGGQVDSRSAREMGMLKDRLKAPYSFERLIL